MHLRISPLTSVAIVIRKLEGIHLCGKSWHWLKCGAHLSARQFCHAEVNFVSIIGVYGYAIGDNVMRIRSIILNTVNSHDSFKL